MPSDVGDVDPAGVSAADAGFSVVIITAYDGLPRRKWMPRAALRAVASALLPRGLMDADPPAVVVIRLGTSSYRRYPCSTLTEAGALAQTLRQEIAASSAVEFRDRRRR
jgi:hypothetical protein